MKKVLSVLLGRMSLVTVLVVVQAALSALAISYLSTQMLPLHVVLVLFSLLVVFWIGAKEDNPTYKLAWIVPIMLFPLFGGLFYLLWGNKKMPKRDRLRMLGYYRTQPSLFARQDGHEQELARWDPHLARVADYIFRTSGFPLEDSTQADYYPLGDDLFEPMVEDLRRARKFILMEYFIIEPGIMWDTILEVLKERAAAGVEVLLLYDDVGCLLTLPKEYRRQLQQSGIRTRVFNPFRARLTPAVNYRDHRKICVVDGNVGYCGGINLADEYINRKVRFGHWKDTAVRLEGAGVWNLTLMFFQTWRYLEQRETGQTAPLDWYRPTVFPKGEGFVQPFGDSPLDRDNVAENSYLQLINRATRYVYITTPYLVLDNEVITALTVAAKSGVDVRIITPHIADKWYVHAVTRSAYPRLVRAGVKIYEYLPGFIHAKMIVSDDRVAMVGTTNMDYRSFYLHFECGVFFYGGTVVEKVRRDIESTLRLCHRFTLEEVRRIPARIRLARMILNLFAPLM